MLVIPLRNHVDEIIGVLQLINRKTSWNKRLKTQADFEHLKIIFSTGALRIFLKDS